MLPILLERFFKKGNVPESAGEKARGDELIPSSQEFGTTCPKPIKAHTVQLRKATARTLREMDEGTEVSKEEPD